MTLNLLEFAEAQFILDKPKDDGSTEREHLMNYWRQRSFRPNIKPEALKFEPLDTLIEYLWEIFYDLGSRRAYTENGPMLVSWSEIQAYCNLKKISFAQWELSALARLDGKYMQVWYKK